VKVAPKNNESRNIWNVSWAAARAAANEKHHGKSTTKRSVETKADEG
jgi:hypothetical protein